jgi:hypothetical protein
VVATTNPRNNSVEENKMKIIMDRDVIQNINQLLFYEKNKEAYAETNRILEEHPWQSDGVTGAEMDEWPEYAAEDYENINRKMIVHILYMLSAIHYEIDYKEMRAMAQKLLLQLAEQPHE